MSFTADTIQKVWEKGSVPVADASHEWRKDECDAWIHRDQYGNRKSDWGWEIDHITPLSRGGTDAISNLRPLQWENNAAKQDDRLVCVVTSSGQQNVRKVGTR